MVSSNPGVQPRPRGVGEESSEGSPQRRSPLWGHLKPDRCSGGKAAFGARKLARPRLALTVRLGAG